MMIVMVKLHVCEPAFSLRAMVPLTKIDAVRCEIRDPGHIITVDWVILPSHDDAYIVGGVDEIISKNRATLEAYDRERNGIPTQGDEDITIPVLESSQWMQYIQEQSFNLKTVMHNFEIAGESMQYNKDTNTVTISESTSTPGVKRTAVVKMDDYIRKEVSSMLANF